MTQTPRHADPAGLQTLPGLPEDLREKILRGEVVLESLTINEWAWTDHNGSLCTLGAGPCLNVVVHNASAPTARGCLAHVRNHHLSQLKIYQTACD